MVNVVQCQRFDLHVHTTASDGVHRPLEVVRMAQEAGLSGIAITDHDTVAGIDEALAEGNRTGLLVVPGIEISTVENETDIHILSYYIDWRDTRLLERLASLRKTRDNRNQMMIDRLRAIGFDLTMEDVARDAASGKGKDETIGRPHIAETLMKRGIVATVSEAFDRYLGKGGAAYVNPPRIKPAEAVEWIREAKGMAVLAHPGLYGDNEMVSSILNAGVDGIEAYHSDHTKEQERYYAQLGEKHGLIVTAGSDFHGYRGSEKLHGTIGNRSADRLVADQLYRAATTRKDRREEDEGGS